MGDFNLADVLRGQLQDAGGDVSRSDTSGSREQIEYIPIERIDGDPNNFYELSSLDELAANIELMGLQQPLRVRTDPESPDRVIVVSGHRRRAALQKLVDEGQTDLREVPCIREAAEGSDALQELRLICANSDTRVLTSAELSRQTERVTALLYQLKGEGMKFTGRMRDYVAEACKISKTKLARLKVIRKNLSPVLMGFYEKGDLNETCAYTLAQKPVDVQELVYRYRGETLEVRHWAEWSVSDAIKKVEAVRERVCGHGVGQQLCGHYEALLQKLFDGKYDEKFCDRGCCEECPKLVSCKSACPLLAEKVKVLRADRAAQNKQEKLAQEERDRPEVEAISVFWAREARARAAAGKSVEELFEATGSYYSGENEKTWLEREALKKIKCGDNLPFGMYGFSLSVAKKLIATADLLGVTTDYLLCRTDIPGSQISPEQAQGQLVISGWMPGWTFPRQPCPAVADFCIPADGVRAAINHRQSCWFDGNCFRSKQGGHKIEAECIRWMALPPVEDDVSNLDTGAEKTE